MQYPAYHKGVTPGHPQELREGSLEEEGPDLSVNDGSQ